MSNIKSLNNQLYLVLDNIRSLLNVGAIFRTAEAVGVKKIFLCGTTTYPTNKLIKKIDGVEINPIIADNNGNPVIKYKPSKKCMKEFLDKEIAKTALAGLNNVEWEYCVQTKDAIKSLREDKVNIIALEQSDKSVDYCDADYSGSTAIIVGNEVLGISETILSLCDQVVHIPMFGIGKSLNVATATGIILYKAIEKNKEY